jgi:hypothetical protein
MSELKGGKLLDDGNIIIIDDASPPPKKDIHKIFTERVMNATPGTITTFSMPRIMTDCSSNAFLVGMPPGELVQLYDWHKASVGKNLILYLKEVYFNQVKAGTKPWEYRECKDYWRKRLEGKTFDFVEIRGGSWGETRTPENTLFFPWRGYEIQELTHAIFGNVPTKVYAIKLVK